MRQEDTKGLRMEVSDALAWFEEQDVSIINPDAVTTHILDRHQDLRGEDADWYRGAAWNVIRDLVRREIGKYKVQPETDEQLVLPGFSRIQRRYLIDVDGTQLAIKVEELTDEQIDAKVAEMDTMMHGLQEHIDELIRYKNARRASA